MKVSKLIKKVNKENTPPDGWKASDAIKKDKPEANKQYALTGGPGDKCISNGNSWKESEVNENRR
jgi:hypothetical protein